MLVQFSILKPRIQLSPQPLLDLLWYVDWYTSIAILSFYRCVSRSSAFSKASNHKDYGHSLQWADHGSRPHHRWEHYRTFYTISCISKGGQCILWWASTYAVVQQGLYVLLGLRPSRTSTVLHHSAESTGGRISAANCAGASNLDILAVVS